MKQLFFRLSILAAVLVLLAASTEADVYVNRLWDEQSAGFKVKTLQLNGAGIRFDRAYQNAYGELNHLDPGPPFFIEDAILVTSSVDADGNVLSFGSVTFESDIGLLQKPFDIYVMPTDITEGRIFVDGPLNFIGSSLDPIKITGGFHIMAGHPGGMDPWVTGQHSMVWQNTNFSYPYFHQNTWNPFPIEFEGGNVTIKNCQFEGFKEFGDIFYFIPSSYATSLPIWDLTVDNCRFENDSVSGRPLIFDHLRRLELRNNYFTNVKFSEYNMSGLVMIDDCGIGAIVDNSAGTNDQNAIRLANSWISDSAFIRTNKTLPLIATAIDVPRDSTLAIGPGSVIKFYWAGGLAVEGRLLMDSVTLTSWNDDVYGGDTDLDPDPPYIDPWHAGLTNTTGGISVDTSGYANIQRSLIRYAEGALYAQGPVAVSDTRIEYADGFGIWMKSFGNEHFSIRNTTISHTSESGYASDYAIMFDNAQGGRQRLFMDSVSVIDGERDGAVIRANSGQPNDIKITNCRFISNYGNGLTVEMWPSLDTVEIDNCSFTGNRYSGLYCPDYQGDSARVIVANSLFAGNGFMTSPGMGANVRAGIPLFVNNTFAYNGQLGLNFYEVARDQARVINNLFYRNGTYGYVMTDPGTSTLSHNAFYGNNDGSQELYFRLPTGTVKTVEEVQATGGDFATNLHLDPQMSAELIADISSVKFDSARFVSVITSGSGRFSGRNLRGFAVSPDTTEGDWFWIAMNTADSLYVVGDVTDIASVGDTYRIFDFHLQDISPLVEGGSTGEVRGSVDIDGEDRIMDADQNGVATVDIGADEYDPGSGHESPIHVTAPAAGAKFLKGDSCKITWQAGGIESVRVLFSDEPDLVPPYWDTVSHGVSAASGEITFKLPIALSSRCAVRVEDVANATTYDLSERFLVKSYVLTHLDGNGNLVRFFVSDDSWPFGNFPDKMWPAAWYNQFDYENGIDTITGEKYPSFFSAPLMCNAKPEQFPDWQLWVRAYGINACYVNTPTGLQYSPSAVAKWVDRKGEWRGACYGFGVSSAMAFFDSAGFRAAYPGVHAFNGLHDLTLNGDNRLVVNELLFHQFGRPHSTYKNSHINDSPREVLAQLKKMLGMNFTAGRVMGIGNRLIGGHALNPYFLEEETGQPGVYKVYVYDSNHPDTTGTYVERYLVLDSAANTWSYSDFPTWNDNNGYCFLMDSASLYTTDPSLPSASSLEPSFARSPEPGYIEVYTPNANYVTIVDTSSDTTSLHYAVVTNDIEGAEPLIPWTGYPTPPVGYSLPEGPYTLWVGTDNSSTMKASVWKDSVHYVYSRIDADPSQLDMLSVDSGLAVWDTDSSLKPCALTYLNMTGGRERQCTFSGLEMDGSQGYELFASDDSTVSLVNHGARNTCSIELWIASEGASRIVTVDDVSIPLYGLSTLIPNWSDPLLSDVRLARDMDGNGTLEDTISLDVVTEVEDGQGDAGLPKRFELAQNYPNPFNISTVIGYDLPRRSNVSIDIINILGQTVRTLVDQEQPAGRYRITWTGTDNGGHILASGVYFYRLTAGDFTTTRKMVLLK